MFLKIAERENQNTFHVKYLFFPKIVKFVRQCGTVLYSRRGPHMTIRRMRIACWITRAKNTHSEYVKRIDFPLQQLLQQRVSVGRFIYTGYLV